MKWKTCLLLMLVLLVCPTFTSGQNTATLNFEILPGSTYTYLPSGFSAGVDGCSPSDFQCDYLLTGMFSLEIDFFNLSASITNSNLVLEGNESVTGPPLTSASVLETWLESQQLFNIPTIATMAAYQVEPSFTRFPLTLAFDTPGINGSLTGGYDARFC